MRKLSEKVRNERYAYFSHLVKIVMLQLVCGYPDGECKQKNYSAFLEGLNNDPTREADHVYAMWSDGIALSLLPGAQA